MRASSLALAAALGLVAAGRSRPRPAPTPRHPPRSADTELSLVAYSTPREAYGKLIPLFQKTPQGEDVGFTQSYGASGEQARAVKAGLNADIVALSLAPDVDELVKAGLVDANWKKQSLQGHGHELGRRLRRARRQPEEDQELGRPAPARRRGRHAEPVHLRRRALERHGRVRRVAEGSARRTSRRRRTC